MVEKIPLKDAINTITCPFDKVVNQNCYVLSPPKIKEIKIIDNGVAFGDGVDLSHFKYNDKNEVMHLSEAFNLIIDWSSDLKVMTTSYVNYMLPRMIEDCVDIPEINDVFFTSVIDTVTGKTSNEYFKDYSKIHKITKYFPRLSNTGQVVSHIRNELTTVAKNNIIINTNRRIQSNIRWRLLNHLFLKDVPYDICKLQDVVDDVFAHLIKADEIKLKHDNDNFISSEVCNRIFKKDIDIVKSLLIDDSNSRSNILKKKKALANNKVFEMSTEKQNFHLMLKLNPHKFLKYLYFIQKEIDGLPLSKEYAKYSTSTHQGMSKDEIKSLWKSWKYKNIKLPSFKLMPLNSIDRQFIRIDKRTLSSLSICIYRGNIDVKNADFTKGIDKGQSFIPKNETAVFYKVKKSFLENNEKNTITNTVKGDCIFHNLDNKKTIVFREIFKSDIDVRRDKWWLDDAVDIYSKKANIRQLRRETLVRSPERLDAFNKIKAFLKNETYNCWIPGASFLTDGVQFKLPLLALRNDRTRGLESLFDKGFTGFKSKPKSKRIDVSKLSRGIFHDSKDNLYVENSENVVVTGIDPGRKRPLSACTVDCADLPDDWNDVQRIYALDKTMDNNVYVSNDEYRKHTGSLDAEEKEKKRRVGDYKKALENMLNTNKRSGLIDTNKDYYSKLFENWNTLRTEKFNIKRSHQRFSSYSKARKSLSHFAKKMTNDMKIKCKRNHKTPVVMFGNGTFSPGGTGQASIPRKPFIRELAVRFPVIITNEYKTSKLHPLSFEELNDISSNKEDKKTTNNERLRVCKTESGNSEVDTILSKERDRDTFGSCSIMQKGYYKLIGFPITSLER